VWKQGVQIEVPVSTNVVPEVTEAIINADYRLKSGALVVDREKMEDYLAWKWGLEESLPAGHRHEFEPPRQN